jgi:hypothetical protein
MERLLNKDLERMWKEAVLVYFEVLSRNVLGGTEENHKKSISIAGLQTRDLNPGSPNYECVLPS